MKRQGKPRWLVRHKNGVQTFYTLRLARLYIRASKKLGRVLISPDWPIFDTLTGTSRKV